MAKPLTPEQRLAKIAELKLKLESAHLRFINAGGTYTDKDWVTQYYHDYSRKCAEDVDAILNELSIYDSKTPRIRARKIMYDH